MCDCDKSVPAQASQSIRPGVIRDQLHGSVFSVDIPGLGTVTAQAHNPSLRPRQTVTAVQVAGSWRIV